MIPTSKAFDIKLWLHGQSYKDHLTLTLTSIPKANYSLRIKIDTWLCSILKFTINPSQRPIFRAHETCKAVWQQSKVFYTYDT